VTRPSIAGIDGGDGFPESARGARREWSLFDERDMTVEGRNPPPPTRPTRRATKLPWLDYGGRFSPLKSAVFVALFVPLALIAYRYGHDELGARPLNEAIHQVGNWTIKLIFLSLAVTPARRILQWPRLILVRRMIGVGAFAYAATHLMLYAADQAFDLPKVAGEILRRIYLTIGFTTLLIVSAMAATSTDGMVRRLGGRRWRRLHRLIYAGALLAVVHFFLQTKAAVDEPWVMAGLYAWLMGYRILAWAYRSDSRVPLWSIGLMSLGSGVLTALGESVYYWIKLGVDPSLVLATNLTVAVGIRPAWVVLSITVGLTATGALRALHARRAKWRLRPT
jgi:sulfoxide reductase heme-binding subunit YedZ